MGIFAKTTMNIRLSEVKTLIKSERKWMDSMDCELDKNDGKSSDWGKDSEMSYLLQWMKGTDREACWLDNFLLWFPKKSLFIWGIEGNYL